MKHFYSADIYLRKVASAEPNGKLHRTKNIPPYETESQEKK